MCFAFFSLQEEGMSPVVSRGMDISHILTHKWILHPEDQKRVNFQDLREVTA
jgi:hypothetical protein